MSAHVRRAVGARLDDLGVWVALAAGVIRVAAPAAMSGAVAIVSAVAFAAWLLAMSDARRRGRFGYTIALAVGIALLWSAGGAWWLDALAIVGAIVVAAAHSVGGRLARRTESAPVALTVITGFLGSGKTTLVNRLLRDPALADSVVIVNEFGDVALDHLLVTHVDEHIVALPNGCLCCTVRGDLVDTLADLFARARRGAIAPFDWVLVETSGLADPGPILHTVMTAPGLADRCKIDGVITVVDAVHGPACLEDHPEASQQVAMADRIVLTKTDLADGAAVRESLAALNGMAPVFEAVRGEIAAARLLGARDELPRDLPTPSAHARHTHGISTHVIERDRPMSAAALDAFFSLLVEHHGPDLLRVKGLVWVEDDPDRPDRSNQPALIQGVREIFDPVHWLDRWPDGVRRTRLVFITRDVPAERLERLLDGLRHQVRDA